MTVIIVICCTKYQRGNLFHTNVYIGTTVVVSRPPSPLHSLTHICFNSINLPNTKGKKFLVDTCLLDIKGEGNSRQQQLNYFTMLYVFNATCFGIYTRSLHRADKTIKKNYYVNRIKLFYVIYIYIYIYIYI
jgi:hypothetical protein